MTISELHNRLLYVKHGGVPLPLPRSSVRYSTQGSAVSGGVRGDLRVTVRASPRGVPHPSSAPQPVGMPLEGLGPLQNRVHHPYPSVLPLMTRCRSLHRRALSLSLWGWRHGCVALYGWGSVVCARPRDDGYAFLGHQQCLHRIPILRGWTSGFLVGIALVLRAPLWDHSSWKWMRS